MTKTELKRLQTKEIIELLQTKFGAYDFDNDSGSYFTFTVGRSFGMFDGSLTRRNFNIMMYDNVRMGPGFEQSRYDKRDNAIKLENELNGAIKEYLKK